MTVNYYGKAERLLTITRPIIVTFTGLKDQLSLA